MVTWFDDTGGIGVPTGGVPTTVARVDDRAGVEIGLNHRVRPRAGRRLAGARVVTGHETPGVFASVTAMPVIVTLPVLVTRNEYGIGLPDGRDGDRRRRLGDRQRRLLGEGHRRGVGQVHADDVTAKFDASLVNEPAVLDVTCTVTVHDTVPASRLPATETVDPPIGAVTMPAGHVVVAARSDGEPGGKVVDERPSVLGCQLVGVRDGQGQRRRLPDADLIR